MRLLIIYFLFILSIKCSDDPSFILHEKEQLEKHINETEGNTEFVNSVFPSFENFENFSEQDFAPPYSLEHTPIFPNLYSTRSLNKNSILVDNSTLIGNNSNTIDTINTKDERSANNQFTGPLPISYRLKPKQSPYDITPGSYPSQAFEGEMYSEKRPYSFSSVINTYMSSAASQPFSNHCNRPYKTSPKISDFDIKAALDYAIKKVVIYIEKEKRQKRSGIILNATISSTTARHQLHSLILNDDDMVKKGVEALKMEYATKFLAERFCLSNIEISSILPHLKISYALKPSNTCRIRKPCSDSRYRNVDGSCNNLKHPFWGKALSCHLRFLPPAYDDGINIPRLNSVTGLPLPLAREIAQRAHIDIIDESTYNSLVTIFGQFINHDIVSTPASVPSGGGFIQCCPKPNHPQCHPILLPKNDFQTINFNRTCMNMVRSAPCPLCTLGPRQQMNGVTSFIDLSTIYGSSIETMKKLRSFDSGLMKTGFDRYGRAILPKSSTPNEDQCSNPSNDSICFDSGDSRVNQHPGLQLMHLLWHRRHNQHAIQLQQVLPRYSDEIIFQEARRMTIAEYQHIIYTEYLPIIMGKDAMEYYKLNVPEIGYCNYDPNVDATTWSEYITAAGRYGHSQIQSIYTLIGQPNPQRPFQNSLKSFQLRNRYFDSSIIFDGYVDPFLKGLLQSNAMETDPYITQDARNHLYKLKEMAFGNDLGALNIQRGRDHGTPPYHALLNFCFGYTVSSWADIAKFIPSPQLEQLKGIYVDWRDIDLFTGGISERKLPDSELGPTFACINGIQFNHLKYGDRYFYSHGGQTGSFTLAQLNDMKKIFTMAGFLCKTANNLEAVPKHAFFPPSKWNPMIPCKDFGEMDHKLWI